MIICNFLLAAGLLAQPPHDLVVYGSTPAAVSAAVQAKRMGASVVVVSPETRLGGLTTGGLGQTDIGNKSAFGGIALEFYRAVAAWYRDDAHWTREKRADYIPDGQCSGTKGADSMWTFEPSAALAILEGWVKRDGIEVVRGERLDRAKGKVKVAGEGGRRRILSFATLSGKTFAGKMFVDATYEGDLMAAAGVSYTVGREPNAQYGETLNGVQTAHARWHQFEKGVDPYVVAGDPKSGLLPGIEPYDPNLKDGTGDRRVQAYCFRMCLTDDPANRIPFAKPADYDARNYELLFRMFAAKPKGTYAADRLRELPWINSRMPNRKTDTNNRDAFSTDFIGRNWNWPEASYEERGRMLAGHRAYQQGLMWTLANHPRVPEAVRREVSRWGTCRDEFRDGSGGGWQAQLYVREARRLVGDYVVTEHDCTGRRIAPRPVAMAAYTMDSHNVRRHVGADGFVHNEGDVEVGGGKPYGLDYGAIVPRRGECANLFVPVCLSASHIAFGSIRMEPVFFALGQAAATAAVQANAAGCAVQDLPYAPLAARLRADGQVVEFRTPVDGVYPHLSMSNDEGECGTGAVVPWAGSLWVVTYGPHAPNGSSDKLYQIKPDLTRTVRTESVGGTPANRMIHRETNQLLIGPYVIDAKGNVRVVPPAKMPGRLTGAGRDPADPARRVLVATMDNGLYSLDMRTLAVKTVLRDHNGEDGRIWGRPHDPKFPFPSDWATALENNLPGSHAKGFCTGFGRLYVANNGEYAKDALTNPWIPSGVLGSMAPDGRDQCVIRRCQFTDIATADGIYGNEHPTANPIWSLGWDAKSVLLAVTTNGTAWTYYRLPKASHSYDGAHGWNTEWPRIREAGLGNGDLLATMHGTFWRFPKNFSPATPNGIRPISTYLKVIGDFAYWKDAPGGGAIVFGCDDHAKNQFLGTRKLKKDQKPNARSTSNLWFVKPEDLGSFGPPSGEGWVWCGEDLKAGALSDPYLWAGYEDRSFTFTDGSGKTVPHLLLHDGDWVRVKALVDVKGANAHFVYGPKVPEKLPALDAKRPYLVVADDKGAVWRFPNVNGDTNVVCREVVTERDLLYAGGVFYEVPAENAGGFAVLRPIALADEPVKTLEVDRGLIVVNGRKMVVDALWKNGTAATAYGLWRRHFGIIEESFQKHR